MTLPTNGQMKMEAKITMGKSIPMWMKLTMIFIGVQTLLYLLGGQLGARLGYYLVATADLPNAVTGFTTLQGGFEFVLTIPQAGAVAVLSLTYQQIIQCFLVNALILLCIAPLKIGVLEYYWKCFRGEKSFGSLLRWYKNPRLFTKAILVSVVLDLGAKFVGMLFVLPGGMLSFWLMMQIETGAVTQATVFLPLLALLSVVLVLFGIALSFFVYSQLAPLAYCLAAQPDYSFSKVWKRGLESTKGARVRFFGFRLSFLPWYIISSLTFGVMDMYVLPYLSFSSFHFLKEVAQKKRTPTEPTQQLEIAVEPAPLGE